jgi:hypothetical protein
MNNTNKTLSQRLGLKDGFVVEPPILNTSEMASDRLRRPMLDYKRSMEYLDWNCPYCGRAVRLEMLDSAENDEWQRGLAGIEEGGTYTKRMYVICRCPREACRDKPIFVIYDDTFHRIMEAYPYTIASADSYPSSIPKKIREDFAEATRCRCSNASRACVVMCRRVIQDIAKDKGLQGATNKEQIKLLLGSGLITKSMFDSAHEIRHYGGFGAHPQDDDLDDITPQIADSLLELTNQFLDNIYVMTAKNAELAKRRQRIAQPGDPE